MAKMFEIKGKTATQNAHMAFAAYNRAKALVPEYNGKIDSVDGEKIKATFKSNKMATDFVTAFESEYTKAHKAYAKAKGKTEKKPTASTHKPKASTPKKTKGKLTLDEFIKANPLCTREEAKAHGFEGTRADLRARKEKLGVR